MRKAASKVFLSEQLPLVVDREDCKVVLACGCFDPLHAGHVVHLEEAKAMGDVLVVVVTADRYVDKGAILTHKTQDAAAYVIRPAFPQEARALVVAGLECVDFVVVNDRPDICSILRLLKPDVLVKGQDYVGALTEKLVREKAVVEEFGGALRFTSGAKMSSTEMLRRLTECV